MIRLDYEVALVEEMILNPDAIKCYEHPERMRGWRRYRIEYGFECGCPEGMLYLPPHVNVEKFEQFVNEEIMKGEGEGGPEGEGPS